MAVNFESLVDFLKVLHSYYEFIFFFDNSPGCEKKIGRGLDALSVNRSFGGAQPHMRLSKIHQEDRLLASEDGIIEGEDLYKIIFNHSDEVYF